MYEEDEAVRRVRAALNTAGCADIGIKITEDTIFTVEDASKAVGAPAEEILKSLVFLVDDVPTLVLMSGANRVDSKEVARARQGKKVKMATPEYVYEHFGFRVGGVPPLGYPVPMPALLDEDPRRLGLLFEDELLRPVAVPVEAERDEREDAAAEDEAALALQARLAEEVLERAVGHGPLPRPESRGVPTATAGLPPAHRGSRR